MKTYFRAFTRSVLRGDDEAHEIQRVISLVIETYPATVQDRPIEPHPKGGYCVFLEFPRRDIDAILQIFDDNDCGLAL